MESRIEQLQALVRSGRFVQAIEDAETLLTEGHLSPQDQAKVHHAASVAYHQTRNVWKAVRSAQAAEGLAAEWEMDELLARVRVNLVGLLFIVGDNRWATEVGTRLLADQETLSDAVKRELPRVHYNLAWICRSLRDHATMFDHLEEAVRLAEITDAPRPFLVQTLQLLAWWRYIEGHIGAGDRHVEQATPLLSLDEWEETREQLLLSALRALQTGDLDSAIDLAAEFLPPEKTQATELQRAWACWIAGSAGLALDHIDEALVIAERGIEFAIIAQSPEMMNRANELRSRIYRRKQELAGE